MRKAFESPQERRARFLQSAMRAESFAEQAPTAFHRQMSLYMAQEWRQMAAEIEVTAASPHEGENMVSWHIH